MTRAIELLTPITIHDALLGGPAERAAKLLRIRAIVHFGGDVIATGDHFAICGLMATTRESTRRAGGVVKTW